MEEFALLKSRVNLNRVNLGIVLISDLKVVKTTSLFAEMSRWFKSCLEGDMIKQKMHIHQT